MITNNLNILLVEDNKISQVVASTLLRKWGMGVTVANDGMEALLLVKARNFNLILMDLQMPIMDGYEAVHTIRSFDDAYFKTVPIIAFSASSMVDTREKAMIFGMTDCIQKPLCVEELKQKIDTYAVYYGTRIGSSLPLTINFDLHTDGDPAFKRDLLILLIDNIRELKQSLQTSLKTNNAEAFLKACNKVSTSIDILNSRDLMETIKSLRAHFMNQAVVSLKEKITLFDNLCDYLVRALQNEIRQEYHRA
jgi:CheY-like chemotaxis protein